MIDKGFEIQFQNSTCNTWIAYSTYSKDDSFNMKIEYLAHYAITNKLFIFWGETTILIHCYQKIFGLFL